MTEQQVHAAKRGRRILTIVGGVILALAIVIGVAGYILLGTSPVPEVSSYQLDVAQVRQLATSGDGALPVRLNALIVAEGANAKILITAGSSFEKQRMVFPSFQVVYGDGTVVVDAVHTQAEHNQSFPPAWCSSKRRATRPAARWSTSGCKTDPSISWWGMSFGTRKVSTGLPAVRC